MRIVSLLPEATAILAQLGVPCQPLHEAISAGEAAVTPDLFQGVDIVFAAETLACGWPPRSVVRRMVAQQRPRPAVYALEPHTLGDLLSDIKTVGDATGQQQAARALIERQRARIDAVTLRSAQTLAASSGRASAASLAPSSVRRVALLASREPPTAAGWWLAELVGLAGGQDVLGGQGRPPRPVTWADIESARPDLVVSVKDLGRLPTVGGWPDPVTLLEQLASLLLGVATRPP